MAISLVTRSGNGAPVTAIQNDANMTTIQTAVNTNITDIAARVTQASFDGYFEGTASGKKQVDWARITNKPTAATTKYSFRATKTGNQDVATSQSIVIDWDSAPINTSGVFDLANDVFVPPVAGIYYLNLSVQVSLVSGSPTSISIITNINVNASTQDQATLDNSGTGTRIYKSGGVFQLQANDQVSATVDFTFSGTGTWRVPSANTSFSGFLVQ